MSLTNFQIANICQQLRIPLQSICMKDELPTKKTQGNFIVNLSSSYEGEGTHWVALIVRDKVAYYEDSFGQLPPLEIIDYCKKRCKVPLWYNDRVIQSIDSSLCGFYCISVLKFITEQGNRTPLLIAANKYSDMFEDYEDDNATILKRYLGRYDFTLKNYLMRKK